MATTMDDVAFDEMLMKQAEIERERKAKLKAEQEVGKALADLLKERQTEIEEDEDFKPSKSLQRRLADVVGMLNRTEAAKEQIKRRLDEITGTRDDLLESRSSVELQIELDSYLDEIRKQLEEVTTVGVKIGELAQEFRRQHGGDEDVPYPETSLPAIGEPAGHLIKWVREIKGWSQARLSEHTQGEVSQQSIQQIEAGKVWDSKHLEPLATALGIDPAWVRRYADSYMPKRGERHIVESGKVRMRANDNAFPELFPIESLPYWHAGKAIPENRQSQSYRKLFESLDFTTTIETDAFEPVIPIGSALTCSSSLPATVEGGIYFVGIRDWNPEAPEFATAQIFESVVTVDGELRLKATHAGGSRRFCDPSTDHKIYSGSGRLEDGDLRVKIIAKVVGYYTSFTRLARYREGGRGPKLS